MTENEFILADRITKIQSINKQYNIENNAYISFSGGKDSTVLHYLLDEALPDNHIPRVFFNTGIEYKAILKFVRSLAERDNRIIIWTVGKNIPKTLSEVGYPFKSKEHSHHLYEYKNGNRNPSLDKYFRFTHTDYRPCPQKLMYQIEPEFKLKVSNRCCIEFKKKPAKEFERKSGRRIVLTGMLKEEGGTRRNLSCIVTDSKTGAIKRFHPLSVVSSDFENWYIAKRSIKLCDLYYPPYNFERTGCKGCPFSQTLQAQLDTLQEVLPEEARQCEYIWKPVYDEYRRIGYRLRKNDGQQSLF